jgi:DNA-binding NarL/FixJ family response regulator
MFNLLNLKMMLSKNKNTVKIGKPYSYFLTGKKINIAIVSPYLAFHSDLTKLMEGFREIEIVFGAKGGKDFQAKIKHNQHVAIMLMDINTSILEGFSTTQWIIKNCPNMSVMLLGTHDDKKDTLKVLEADTGGYLLKELTSSALLNAIKAMLSKQLYLNNKKNDLDAEGLAAREIRNNLRERELLFLQLCCTELTYKQIANILHISPRTIDNYRENLCIKLGVKTRVGLVVYSIKNGLVSLL